MNHVREVLNAAGLSQMDVERVSGGDINEAYKVYNHHQQFFLKLNDATAFPGMFQQEALGLQTLAENSRFIVPQVMQYGTAGSKQYLLLQWIERSPAAADYWKRMGEQLAELHHHAHTHAGFTNDNYIGSLVQPNTPMENWAEFYAAQRLQPVVEKLVQVHAFSAREQQFAFCLYERLSDIFPNEKHALLHGDLWGGNHFPNENGLPVLIDPAVYYGHREMDIGMTSLFGGFSKEFYEAYHYHYPLESLWQQRLQLTQLYPLLVHAVLFGGHYVSESAQILMKFGR